MMNYIAGAALEALPVLVVMALGAFASRLAIDRVLSYCNSALQRIECSGISVAKT
jgi:hypothetical protein